MKLVMRSLPYHSKNLLAISIAKYVKAHMLTIRKWITLSANISKHCEKMTRKLNMGLEKAKDRIGRKKLIKESNPALRAR